MIEAICLDSDGNVINSFTQWDIGQSLVITNSGLTRAPTFHFCNQKSSEALTVNSTIKNGAITVRVPNILLQEPFPILVYMYMYSSTTSAKVVKMFRIPVKPRVKPSEYIYTEDMDKNLYINDLLSKKENILSVSATFDKNGLPLSIVDKTILSAGDFSSGYKEAVTVFIPSSVTSVQGGSLSGCTNLTDVYIDNTSDQVTISNGAIPSTAKIHYKDTYNSLSQIEYALKKLSSSIDVSTLTGKIPVSNLPDEALTRIQVVNDDETRLKLTTSLIQDGDFVKVESTGKIYIVKDSGRLGTEGAFIEISSSVDSIDASAIKGKIPVENLPMEALTRLITVGDDAARLALDKSLIQNGDFVKVESTGKIYIVKDSGRLGREDAFVEISGGSSSNNPSVDVSTAYDEDEELLNITTTNSGTIPVDNLPPEALTRLVKVDNETSRLLLTDETVQNGDLVKVESTNKTYIVYDSSKLGTEEAFEEVTGTAISASYDAADQSILL